MKRPRIKPEHAAYRTVDGTVRMGSAVYGIGVEMDDPDGWIWTLAESLDGSRSPAEIARTVVSAHPQLTEDEILQAVADLRAAGHLEDAAATAPQLSKAEQDRYSRGVPLLRWLDRSSRPSAWEMQEQLRRSRVLLIGLGGTGGHAAQALVASGVGHLHCVDPDTVELSNLNRQPLYRERDIDRPKVEAALSDLRALNRHVDLSGERLMVTGPNDLVRLLGGGRAPYDLLLMCADKPPEIRRWANRVCLDTRIPWVDGGYRGPLVSAGVHHPDQGACWECLRAGEAERADLGLAPGQDEEGASSRTAWNPASAVTAGLSGLLVAHAAIALLTGAPPTRPGFRHGINLAALDDTVLLRHPRKPGCPDCGRSAAPGRRAAAGNETEAGGAACAVTEAGAGR